MRQQIRPDLPDSFRSGFRHAGRADCTLPCFTLATFSRARFSSARLRFSASSMQGDGGAICAHTRAVMDVVHPCCTLAPSKQHWFVGHLRSYYCLLQLQYVKTTTEQRLSPTRDHNPTVFLQLPYNHSPTTTRRLWFQDKNLLASVRMANEITGQGV